MRYAMHFFLLMVAVGLLSAACSRKSQPSSTSSPMEPTSGLTSVLPPCIIYKTKGDYSGFVPVLLSDDRSRIVMYPDVIDIQKQGDGVFPTPLEDGFYLDNRGIGPNVAFLDITYKQFMAFPSTPSAGDLFDRILDADPLVVMYQCGTRSEMETMVEKLNGVIREGTFVSCKKLK